MPMRNAPRSAVLYSVERSILRSATCAMAGTDQSREKEWIGGVRRPIGETGIDKMNSNEKGGIDYLLW